MVKAETSLAWPGDPIISRSFIPWSQQQLLDLPSSPTSYIHTHKHTHTNFIFSSSLLFFREKELTHIRKAKAPALHFRPTKKKSSTWAGQGTLLSPCMTLNRLLQIGLLGLSWSFLTRISKSYENKIQWRWRGCKNLRRRHQDLASCLRGRTGAYDMYQQTNKQPHGTSSLGKFHALPPPIASLAFLLPVLASSIACFACIFVSEKLRWGM